MYRRVRVFFFFQAEDGIRDGHVTGVQTCALPICDRSLLCRQVLTEITYPEYAANWETAVEDRSLPAATRLALASTDPRNITLEPEYYSDCDDARFQRVKPLLWLWYSFDRLPIGGQNVDLGVRLRRLLAPY